MSECKEDGGTCGIGGYCNKCEHKLYAERDIIEQGEFYTRHVQAMTHEGLHSKSDIAAELAHRDMTIDQLIKLLKKIDNGGNEQQVGVYEV